MKRAAILLCLACSGAVGDSGREEPVGLVLTATGTQVLRVNTETPLAARAGDILFAGDALKAQAGTASFLYCPNKTSDTLESGAEVIFDAKQLKVKAGKLGAPKPINACFLPQLVRVAVASQQHYGVSMTRGLAKPDDDPPAISSLDSKVQADVAPFESELKTNANDAAALVEEAAVFEKSGLEANALADYRKAAAAWPDAVWVRGRMFDIEESMAAQAALKAAQISPDAKTYALLVGISKYEKLPKEEWLQYANADAKTFETFLASGRGGGVPADQTMTLTDETATTAALRNGFQTFLRNRAGKKDTVFILVAGHGIVDSRGAYILTYDSDPQDLSATALPMAEIQELIDTELSKVGRVVFLADICHAATIAGLRASTVGSAVEKLGEAQGEMLGLMAARPKELSIEGPQFGGGHGAFTYSVLKGLGGLADHNDDRYVEAGELIDFVRDNTAHLTGDKQHPRDFGNMANETKLSDLSKPGIELSGLGSEPRFLQLYDSRNGGPLYIAAAGDPPLSSEAQRDMDTFEAAIRDKRLLPDQAPSAFDPLARLRTELTPEQLFLAQNRLRVALEDQAQQVLLRYLAGDQTPQTKAEFDAGSKYMEAAMRLTPESLYLQGRDSFFEGRALLFERNYGQAANLLENSVRIDPGEAYGYNALGIAYLEQADFTRAIPAFRDAAKRAPNWSYPLHNLALAYVEAGDYTAAIRSYQQAMKLTPQYSYLPYNLGLVYQRLNRRRDAEASYRKAMELAPDSAEPLNALGTLKASEGKGAEAERLYREALEKNPALLAARHNLGLLVAKTRPNEAIDLWRQNLKANPDYIASRLSLAELLAEGGDNAGAAAEYEEIIRTKPQYVGARTALAAVLMKAGKPGEAAEQLREAVKQDAEDAAAWERLGDAERAGGHGAEARTAYGQAEKLAQEKSARKRIRAKMTF